MRYKNNISFDTKELKVHKKKSQEKKPSSRIKSIILSNPFLKNKVFSKIKKVLFELKRQRVILSYKLSFKVINKKDFIDELKKAIENGIGYATGKIGQCQEHLMYYQIILHNEKNQEKVKEFEKSLSFHGIKQTGIFPDNLGFYLSYNDFYINHVRNIDCLGICYYLPYEYEILKYYKLKNRLIYFIDQEPDRSSPNNENKCYLRYFRDKKILIICPFAELLRARANGEIFERVWSKTDKKWFYPKSVEALEFPYGFSSETQKSFSNAINLFNHITAELDKRDFEIALIAAAGLAIPLASYVKTKGKIAIDLGGHLQILFGVIGKRWRQWESWKMRYFNDWWIDMPPELKPKETDVCDNGAYW